MANIGSFFVELGLKKEKFDQGMKDAEKAPSKLGSKFAAIGTAIAASFVAIGTAAVAFAVKSMAAWDQQVKAEEGLLKALKGRKDVQQALIKQAGDLQRKTLFGDEATIEAQKMLAIMGLSATQIKDMIPLVQDFSTATGMDLAGAANLVGKSIGTGTNALARYGIEIDSTMSKSEKGIAVMAKFTEMYGGQAAAAAKVGTSGLQQLRDAWSDITEIIGAKVGPFLSALAKLTSGKLLDAAAGANATGLQKTVNEYLNADKVGRDKIVSGLKMSLDEYNKLWKKAIDENDQANRQHYSLQADYVREALGKINELEKEGVVITELTEEQKRAAWDKTQAKIRETADLAQEVADTMRASLSGAMAQTPSIATDYTLKPIDLIPYDVEESEDDPAWLTKLGEDLLQAKDMWTQFQGEMAGMVADFTADVLGTFFEGLGEAIAGGNMQDTLNNIIGLFGDFIGQLGKMMIAYGTSALLFTLLGKNPSPASAIALIAAGAAMAAIGGAIKQSMSKGVGSTGGMSGVGGSYSNSVTGYGNTEGMGYVLSTDISGDNLRIIMQRADRNAIRRG